MMNKKIKLILVIVSIVVLSVLGIDRCMRKYGDMSSIGYQLSGMNDDGNRSSQEGMIYQLDEDGNYIRVKGKKQFRDPREISEDYYIYITNSYFSNMTPMIRTRDEKDLTNFSMGTAYKALLEDKREIEPQFIVLDYRNAEKGEGISLLSGVIEEIEEDMSFELMREVLEIQIEEIWKKMYPEDVELLDKIKAEIPANITIYTNMENHLEKKHLWRYEIRFGQRYLLKILRYISPISEKHFYTLSISRIHISL